MPPGPIFLINGVPGAGKSTVSDLLMRRFPRSIHISVDRLRDQVVSGYADPTEPWTGETELQFRMARQSAAEMAARYADAGFAVAIDDTAPPFIAEFMLHILAPREVYRVRLQPDLDTVLIRNATRTNKSFDTSCLVETIEHLYHEFEELEWPGWTVIDTSNQMPEQTVDDIQRMIRR